MQAYTESEKRMLKQQLSQLWKSNIDNQVNNEELKQYCRNIYIRFDDVRNVNNKSSNDVVKLMKSIFTEATQWTSRKLS